MGGKMATLEVKICDLCNSREEVSTMAVVWKRGDEAPWELDLCDRCYTNRMSDMREVGRRAKINNVRPQARVRKTHITEANL
jgi:hypothetical protein